jgi:hypothetical protein
VDTRVCGYDLVCDTATTAFTGGSATSDKGSFSAVHRNVAGSPARFFVTDTVANSWGSAYSVGTFEMGVSSPVLAIGVATDIVRMKIRSLVLDDGSYFIVAARSGSSGNDLNILRCLDSTCAVNSSLTSVACGQASNSNNRLVPQQRLEF